MGNQQSDHYPPNTPRTLKNRQPTQNANPNWRNTPTNTSKKDIIASIDDQLTALFAKGELNSRKDVEQALTDNGYTISRNTGFDSVSIKHPNDPTKPNIKLKGFWYETKTYDDKTLKSQYIAKIAYKAHRASLSDDNDIPLPQNHTERQKRLQSLYERFKRL